jgi:hypothetical protein
MLNLKGLFEKKGYKLVEKLLKKYQRVYDALQEIFHDKQQSSLLLNVKTILSRKYY